MDERQFLTAAGWIHTSAIRDRSRERQRIYRMTATAVAGPAKKAPAKPATKPAPAPRLPKPRAPMIPRPSRPTTKEDIKRIAPKRGALASVTVADIEKAARTGGPLWHAMQTEDGRAELAARLTLGPDHDFPDMATASRYVEALASGAFGKPSRAAAAPTPPAGALGSVRTLAQLERHARCGKGDPAMIALGNATDAERAQFAARLWREDPHARRELPSAGDLSRWLAALGSGAVR